MDIDTALKYMTIEKAIELEQRRFFCNADETINTIAVYCMEKQIPTKIKNRRVLKDFNGHPYAIKGDCPFCGCEGLCARKTDYCICCGQRIEWED